MPIEDLALGMLFGAAGSLVLWVTIGRKMMLKYAGKSVINAILQPNEDTKLAIESLFNSMWQSINSPSVEQKMMDDKGKEISVKVTPLEIIMQKMGDMLWVKLRGMKGALTSNANRMEASLAQGLGISMPRRGQSTGEFLVEQLANRLMPIVEQRLTTALNNRGQGIEQKPKEGW
jgi:hypothetical protein